MCKSFFVILLCSLSVNAQTNWQLLAPKPSFLTGLDMHFVSKSTGYIMNQSEILETTDAGLSWQKKQNITSGFDMDFHDSVGYIVGYSGYVLRTVNSGQNWSKISTSVTINYNSVTVVDLNNIFLSSQNKLVKSSDGGITWQSYTIPNSQVNKTTFVNALVGHAVCENGTILKTIDGGVTWYPTMTSNLTPSGYFTIYFINENLGFATHEHNTMLKTINGGETWTEVTGSFESIYSFHFVNDTIGYACGELGVIYKTVNGGSNWTSVTNQFGVDYTYNFALYFTDENIGYITGHRGRILKTTNGGASWSSYFDNYNDINKIEFPTENAGYALVGNSFFKSDALGDTWIEIGPPQQNEYTINFDFVSENVAFAIGGGQVGTSAKSRKIFKTTNAGTNWTQLSYVSPIFDDDLYCLEFIDENIGFVSGGFNQSGTWKTVDGGNSWNQLNTLRFGQIQFINNQVGYARNAGNYYNRIYKTTDGGITWNITFEKTQSIKSFQFLNENVGYFVGDNAMMYKTIDGGTTWEQLTIPYEYYTLVKFYNTSLGYITDDNGNLYRTTDGGMTWQNLTTAYNILSIDFKGSFMYISGSYGKILRANLGTLSTSDFTLEIPEIQIFPNPATNQFFISASENSKIESVCIFDMMGRTIMTVPNTNDSDNLKIDFLNRSKGVYLVKVIFDTNMSITKKLTLE